jgi:NADP-dependent 3-hydroxy acid dehydrogenase YdfG
VSSLITFRQFEIEIVLVASSEHRLERLTQAAKEMSEATGRTCIPAQADVRQPQALKSAVAKAIEQFGRIDFVICGK